jgi:hypothetical protein
MRLDAGECRCGGLSCDYVSVCIEGCWLVALVVLMIR